MAVRYEPKPGEPITTIIRNFNKKVGAERILQEAKMGQMTKRDKKIYKTAMQRKNKIRDLTTDSRGRV